MPTQILHKFRKLFQGSKYVEKYDEEFENLRNRLKLNEYEESLMDQFIDGLQDRIARKVERQPYNYFQEILHLYVQVK